MFKDPLKRLWFPFVLNCFAVVINVLAASISIWIGGWAWTVNLLAAGFSTWVAVKEYKKIPQRKADLQRYLLASIKGY